MKERLLKIYQILGIIAALIIVAEVAVFYFLLTPVFKQLRKEKRELNTACNQMRSNSWPVDINRLNAIKNEYKGKLDSEDDEDGSITYFSNMTKNRANATLQSIIKQNYSSQAEFMRNASRLDYQAEHNRIFSHFAKRGFVLSPKDVGLEETSPSPYVYQLLLQLWTMEKVMNLVADSGLALSENQPAPTAKNRYENSRNSHRSSQKSQLSPIRILPMKAYSTNKNGMPYLLEFPMQICLSGPIASGKQFMDALQKNDTFIPITSFELFALPPAKNGKSDSMLFKLECSSFLYLER